MDLSAIIGSVEDQDRGSELELLHPVTGKPTGIKLVIAGPDSTKQRAARHQHEDELRKAVTARNTAALSSAARADSVVLMLARCILSWTIEENGNPVPFTHENVVRLLKAGTWVQEQVDQFAGDRTPYAVSLGEPAE